MTAAFSPPLHRSGVAFSLVELLVALGVLAVLVALLVPVATRVREGMITTQCLSNLRQIGIALNSYANEQRQFYPPTFSSTRIPNNRTTWMTAAGPYLGYAPTAMGGAPRARAVGVFYCPALNEQMKEERRVGYFYNSGVVGATIRRQPLAPQTFLVVEGQPANSEAISKDAFLAAPPNRHHRGAANFLSVDGSVRTFLPPFDRNDPRWEPDPQ